ncbi:MAG TPA: cupin domain-containing protein [Candidatus Dormibacteraeota bacterium]|nr:cupin domain-containing protein [Candidatus Dormibacteraeota bacterium]
MVQSASERSLGERLEAHVGRYLQKVWDWDAFPASRGYPELARAQMRYVGSGGSPKAGDATTLTPQHFTCSLLYQEPGRYAAVHTHEIEEVFFVLEGRLTVSWDFDDELVDVVLGPGDALWNPPERAHGFRNDGPSPMTAQFMVGHPKPMLPAYKSHPSRGGAAPEFGQPLPSTSDPRVAEIRRHLIRASDVETRWLDLGGGSRLAHQPYVWPPAEGGVVTPARFSLEMLYLPPGACSPLYRHPHETAFMVWEGVLTVDFEEAGARASTRLAARDLVMAPAGQRFRLRNEGAAPMRAAVIMGTPTPASNFWSGGEA